MRNNILLPHTSLGKKDILFNMFILWNSLSENLKNIASHTNVISTVKSLHSFPSSSVV